MARFNQQFLSQNVPHGASHLSRWHTSSTENQLSYPIVLPGISAGRNPDHEDFKISQDGRLVTAIDAYMGGDCEVYPAARLTYDALSPAAKGKFHECPMYLVNHVDYARFLGHLCQLDLASEDPDQRFLERLGNPIPGATTKENWGCAVKGCVYVGTRQHVIAHLRRKKHLNIPMYTCRATNCDVRFFQPHDRRRHMRDIHQLHVPSPPAQAEPPNPADPPPSDRVDADDRDDTPSLSYDTSSDEGHRRFDRTVRRTSFGAIPRHAQAQEAPAAAPFAPELDGYSGAFDNGKEGSTTDRMDWSGPARQFHTRHGEPQGAPAHTSTCGPPYISNMHSGYPEHQRSALPPPTLPSTHSVNSGTQHVTYNNQTYHIQTPPNPSGANVARAPPLPPQYPHHLPYVYVPDPTQAQTHTHPAPYSIPVNQPLMYSEQMNAPALGVAPFQDSWPVPPSGLANSWHHRYPDAVGPAFNAGYRHHSASSKIMCTSSWTCENWVPRRLRALEHADVLERRPISECMRTNNSQQGRNAPPIQQVSSPVRIHQPYHPPRLASSPVDPWRSHFCGRGVHNQARSLFAQMRNRIFSRQYRWDHEKVQLTISPASPSAALFGPGVKILFICCVAALLISVSTFGYWEGASEGFARISAVLE